MVRLLILFLLSVVLPGCGMGRKVVFKYFIPKANHEGLKKVKYKLQVPRNYSLVKIEGAGVEYQMWYPDSSVIYITNDTGLPLINQDNILNQEGAYGNRFIAFINNDTIISSGSDERGLLWKDIRLEFVSVGYSSVSPEKAPIFDSAIESINFK